MLAGKLDRRLILQRDRAENDPLAEGAERWTTVATVWAAYMPVSDGERQRASETSAVIDCRFHIRRTSKVRDASPKWRAIFEGRTFNIVGVKEIDRKAGLEISARARAE